MCDWIDLVERGISSEEEKGHISGRCLGELSTPSASTCVNKHGGAIPAEHQQWPHQNCRAQQVSHKQIFPGFFLFVVFFFAGARMWVWWCWFVVIVWDPLLTKCTEKPIPCPCFFFRHEHLFFFPDWVQWTMCYSFWWACPGIRHQYATDIRKYIKLITAPR